MDLKHLCFSFDGRIGRGEFWLVMVPIAIVTLVLSIMADSGNDAGAIILIAALPFILWVGFAVTAKRLHDIGASGWWILVNIIPIAGLVMFFVLGFKPGNPEANQYGSPPTG